MNASRATVLLPASASFGAQRLLPAVARRLGQALPAVVEPGRRAQLRRRFKLADTQWPLAALSRQGEHGDAGDAPWLRADPAWMLADINGVRLMTVGEGLGLDAAEVEELAPMLAEMFAQAGMQFDWPHPARAWLRLPGDAALPQFSDPADALGADVFDHTDTGDAARQWRTLAGEAQMLLHAHPLNRRRTARGLPPVNALWFWGAGRLPHDEVQTAHAVFDAVSGNDPSLAALAAAAGTPVTALADAYTVGSGRQLIDLAAIRDLRQLQQAWLQPALQALDRGVLDALTLDFADGHVLELRRGQRWRFWRAPLPWPWPE
ncbi:phosphoglycerate mutase [Luteimonas sp. e5]